MFRDTATVERNCQHFVERVIERRVVFYLVNEHGPVAYVSNDDEDRSVLLFFSDAAHAKAVREKSARGSEIEEMDLFDFLYKWLPGMNDDGLLSGPNWTGDLVGLELEPNDLRKRIESNMSADHRQEYIERCASSRQEAGFGQSEENADAFVAQVTASFTVFCLKQGDDGAVGSVSNRYQDVGVILFYSQRDLPQQIVDEDIKIAEIDLLDFLDGWLPSMANQCLAGLDWTQEEAIELDPIVLRDLILQAIDPDRLIEHYQGGSQSPTLESYAKLLRACDRMAEAEKLECKVKEFTQ